MKNAVYQIAEKHPASLLLVLGFFLQGAKTPLTFFIWASTALALCVWNQRENFAFLQFKSHPLETCLLLALGLSFLFSKDPSVSLFPTWQAITLLLLWLWLKTTTLKADHDSWWVPTIAGLAILTILRTAYQMSQGLWGWGHAVGFLPTHPGLNALWMASLACYFAARRKKRWELPLAIVLAGMVLVGPSRGTLLALGCGLLYTISPWITARRLCAVLGILTLTLALTPQSLLYRRLRLDEDNHRIKIWKIAARAGMDQPWVGYGLGNFEMAYHRYAFPMLTDTIRYARTTEFAHNEYLQVLSDLGLPAFIILLIAALKLVRRSAGSFMKRVRPEKAALLTMAVAAFYIPTWHLPLFVFLSIVWGGAIYRSTTQSPLEPAGSPDSRRAIHQTALILLLVAIETPLAWCAIRDEWAQKKNWSLIVKWNSMDGGAWKNLAGQEKDTCGKGLLYYAEAVRRVPDQVYFREGFGNQLEACHPNNNLNPALEEYQSAFRLAPYRAMNALSIARIRYIQGHWRESIAWVEAARLIEPNYWECDLWLARAYQRLGQPKHAQLILKNLSHRRQAHLNYQKLIRPDLPWPNDPSDYSDIILNYDDRVIDQELKSMAHAQ